MTDWRAEVCGPWVAGNGDASNHPRIVDDYDLISCVDITGQVAPNLLPAPNLYNVEITCTEVTINLIESDENYLIVWSEEINV